MSHTTDTAAPLGSARAFADQARSYEKSRQRTQAIAAWQQAMTADPSNADYPARAGHLKNEIGQPPAAWLPDIDRAIALDAGHANARFDRALYRYVNNDLAGARSDIDVALARQPDSTRFLGARCVIGAASDKRAAALEFCERALRAPDAVSKANALTSQGQALLELGQSANALKAFEAALDTSPRLGRARYGLGLAKIRLGDTVAGGADIAEAQSRLAGAGREFRLP